MKSLSRYLRQSVGERAECLAEKYLKRQGLKRYQSNYHSRFGEIDLIMRDGGVWVFVEVRCRAAAAPVSAVESITQAKIQRIRKTAQVFLQQFEEMPECRFDVICMTHNQGKIDYNIFWIKNAF